MTDRHTLEEMCDTIRELISSEGYVPMDMRDMTDVLTLEPGDYDLFAESIEYLERAGELAFTKKGRIMRVEGSGLINCIYRATTRGFGFASTENGGEIYIPPEYSLGAMNGDRVQVRLTLHSHRAPDDRKQGEILRILERAVTELVGSFRVVVEYHRLPEKVRGKLPRPKPTESYVVKPDDPKLTFRVKIPPSARNGAKDGDKVLVRLTKYPSAGSRCGDDKAVGKVLRVFGERDSMAANYEAILVTNGIRTSFPPEVRAEAERIASEPIIPDGRLDLRDRIIFTIDGAGAKDFDDAVSVEPIDGGWLLGVHIADVSHYVKANSPLDNEAFERGMSVYFTDKVIPMLPEELSNGVCSLNRDSDKYTLSALIKLDNSGRILETSLHRAIISSKVRGVYSELNDVIELGERSEFYDKYAFLFPDVLPDMLKVYEILKKKSEMRGSLELETVEAGIILDDEGMPVKIVPNERGVAEKLIEQFMLCANEAVAGWLFAMGMPCVYRVHEEPLPEKVRNFAVFACNLGLDIKPLNRRKLMPGCYREVYNEAKEKGVANVLNVMMLRSLAKAKYSAIPGRHFGLGCELYCHFTSPIRRYPDLAVHRIISSILDGKVDVDRLEAFAAASAERSSENELRIVNAEREIEDLYKTVYLSGHIGECFDGIISTVAPFGFFVELPDTCEGLVPISSLDGFFEYDEQAMALFYGKKCYRTGDPAKVRVVSCDIITRRVEFEVVD